MRSSLTLAETELTKARTGYQQYATDGTDGERVLFTANVHHYLGHAQLRHAGMTLLEADTIAHAFENARPGVRLSDVLYQYASTHTV